MYDKTRDQRGEYLYRQQGKLAVSILEIDEEKIEFCVGDNLAVIDCISFSPEHIPVLRALDAQHKLAKPFDQLRLLNIGIPQHFPPDDTQPTIPVVSSPTSVHDKLAQMLSTSSLDPIVQCRRYDSVFQNLVHQLSQLVTESKLDSGQLDSFLGAMTHPVHCTQGPPGTGKSYLGVVIIRALMLVRKAWMQCRPDIGSPPILVLSYKNHAIDKLAVDLVHADRRSKLIRVGHTDDPTLQFFQEQTNIFTPECTKWRTQLEEIFNTRTQINEILSKRPGVLLSQLQFSDKKAEKRKLFPYVQSIGEAILLVKQLFSVFHVEDIGEFWDTVTFSQNVNGSNAFQRIREVLQYSDAPAPEELESLLSRVRHYEQSKNFFEILLMWLQGDTPLLQCSFINKKGAPCSSLCKKEYVFCSNHACAFPKCHNSIASNKKYCLQHMCQNRKCKNLRLRDPQIFCGEHVCVVCVNSNRSIAAKEATDEAPRNVCPDHKLCCAPLDDGSLCDEFALQQCELCMVHFPYQCHGITKKNARCKSKPKSYSHPFCKDHEIQEKTFQRPQKLPRTLPVGLEMPLSYATKTECSETQEEHKTINVESSKNVTSPSVEIVIASSTVEDVKHPNGECQLESSELDPFDEIAPDNIDEYEEPEHISHIRDVFLMEEKEEQFMHQGEILLDQQAEPKQEIVETRIPAPVKWNWDMSLDERWEIVRGLVAIEGNFLKKLDKYLLQHAEESRRMHHLAKLKAVSKLYQNAEVIAGTIVGCITRLEAIRATNPFAILVEEASEVSEPLLFACFCPTTCKLELIGDHRQLQPSMMEKFDFERINKVNISMFERLVCGSPSFPVPFGILSVQRRMRSNICDLTRDFYRDVTQIIDDAVCGKRRLETVKKLNQYQLSSSLLAKCEGNGREVPGVLPHIFFWSHSGKEGRAEVGISRVNLQEANMAAHLASYLVSCGVSKSSIAVLTPYKGQLMLLRQLLLKNGVLGYSPAETCRLSTVDRFQGDEADLVIISLVIDANSRTPFVQLVNRMIVLLSRARLAMYILGNEGYFKTCAVEHWEHTFHILLSPSNTDTTEGALREPCLHYAGRRMGPQLPICCPRHRASSTMASTPEQLQLGFCKVKCEHTLSCTHACGLACHWPTEKHNAKCQIAVDSPCAIHPRKLICHDMTKGSHTIAYALSCYQCDESVDVLKPCMHTEKFPCWEERSIAEGKKPWPQCSMPALQKFIYDACRHAHQFNCHDYTMYMQKQKSPPPCHLPCQFMPSCSHTITIPCYLKQQYENSLTTFICKQNVNVILPRCGHPGSVPCPTLQKLHMWKGSACAEIGIICEGTNYGPIDYECKETVTFIRKCGHKQQIPCGQAFELSLRAPQCLSKVDMQNPVCGHLCQVKCFEATVLAQHKRTMPTVETVLEGQELSQFMQIPDVPNSM